jgi:predicted dehydrogenase
MLRSLIGLMALTCLTPLLAVEPTQKGPPDKVIRVGIIGLDSSHCVEFTKLFHDPKASGDAAGFRVVAGYPGGSPDVASSRDRVDMFTKTLKEKYDVEIVASIEELLKKVDVVIVGSVDGRPHYEQAKLAILAGKPLFIDKPIAGTLIDVLRIFQLAAKHKVPVFSSSGLRFSPGIASMRDNKDIGDIVGCDAWGPCSLEEHHPDLFWYGVHGVETLYTIMGTGCEKVVRVQTKGTELVTGTWKGGRVGTFRGIRQGKGDYGAMVFGTKSNVKSGGFGGYLPLVAAVGKFFRTGQPPVAAEETTEMFAFMEAADESKRQGGSPVTLESVMKKAQAQIGEGK